MFSAALETYKNIMGGQNSSWVKMGHGGSFWKGDDFDKENSMMS